MCFASVLARRGDAVARDPAEFPYVVKRLGCAFCPRPRSVYRRVRLAERYGANARLDTVRRDLGGRAVGSRS